MSDAEKPKKKTRPAVVEDYISAAVGLHDYAYAELKKAGASRSVLLSLGRRMNKIEQMPTKGVEIKAQAT